MYFHLFNKAMHDRRKFIKLLACGAAASVIPMNRAMRLKANPNTAITRRPNIIFILADDLGYQNLGSYGQEVINTPHLDILAREGTRFTQCYAGSPICAPSRNVLMTGQHLGHTRLRGNHAKIGGIGPEGRVALELENITVAEVLKNAGYATGIAGKWGLGEPQTTGLPGKQGFDKWLGYLNQDHAREYFPEYLWNNETIIKIEGNEGNNKGNYSLDIFTEFALNFIREHHDTPFFLYLPWTPPHGPHNDGSIPSTAPYTNKSWPMEEKVFAAMISHLDYDVGRIMALLKELNIGEDTIVFFSSDNGGLKVGDERFGNNGPLRGYKGDLYEGGIRTPMIVRWPGKVPVEEENDSVWYFADFLPTAAELAGVSSPTDIDGISVLPMLLGKMQNTEDRFLYWENHWKVDKVFVERGFQQAVRWRHWKAIRQDPGMPLELYNLSDDLSENYDLADSNPEVLAEIENFLKTARTDSLNWPLR